MASDRVSRSFSQRLWSKLRPDIVGCWSRDTVMDVFD